MPFRRYFTEHAPWSGWGTPNHHFAGADCVLKYLARYTHRIAITNHRLLEVSEDHVHFTWKDYKHDQARRIMRLEISEFVRRFLLHVLPDRFVRIRYYGLLAQSQRATTLPLCRRLLKVSEPSSGESSAGSAEPPAVIASPLTCPNCGSSQWTHLRTLPPPDTS